MKRSGQIHHGKRRAEGNPHLAAGGGSRDGAELGRGALRSEQGRGTNQPVVIVEFKRPASKSYGDETNPVKQIYDYIREIRGNKVTDNVGKLITEVGNETPFFCYLVCDITSKLKGILEDYNIIQSLPGNRGYFGYSAPHGAYLEVLEYSRLVEDARLRHEAFFDKLGVN